MKKIHLIILTISILLFQEIKAQTNFQEGYILISEFDTLYGKIDTKDYFQNSEYCDFIRTNSQDVVRYYPDKIYGYRFVDGKFYVSKNIEFENKQSVLFLEYLLKGKLNLFYFQDKGLNPHFYVTKDTIPLQELKYNKGIKEVDGILVFYKQKQYTGVLSYLTSDCPEIKDEIAKLDEPGQAKLIKLAKKYNNLVCPDESCILYDKKIPKKIKLGAYIGSQVLFRDDYPINNINLRGEIFPSYSFNILFQQAQRLENMYIGIGFTYVPKIDSITNFYRIPLSLTFLNSKKTFSPIFSLEFDINKIFMTQALVAGLKYQRKKLAFTLNAKLNTVFLVIPYGATLNLGIIFDLR